MSNKKSAAERPERLFKMFLRGFASFPEMSGALPAADSALAAARGRNFYPASALR
jgi:hypothetical protein